MKTANGQGGARRSGPAFTLVEIMAAMSLSVIILLGVVQVFKMATDSTSLAEATSDAYGVGRAIFRVLQKDLAALSPEGYLYIQPSMLLNPEDTRDDKTGEYFKKSSTNTMRWCNFDCLYFTAVGRFQEMGTGSNNPQDSAAAEIFYGPARRSDGSRVSPWAGSMQHADGRSVCLIRKAFLSGPTMTAAALRVNSTPTAGQHTFLMMQAENVFSASPSYRLTPLAVGSSGDYGSSSAQIIDVDFGSNMPQPSVNYVLSERVSQFIVEFWGWDGSKFKWQRATLAPSQGMRKYTGPGSGANYYTSRLDFNASTGFGGGSTTEGPVDTKYLWCGYRPNPKFANQPFVPQMLRVTVVVHPHNDQTPLSEKPYGSYQYRGDVFRQVFRVVGPRGGLRTIPAGYLTTP